MIKILLSPFFLCSLRFEWLPAMYLGETSIRYWGMAFFITLGAMGSLIAYEQAKAKAVRWIETHARTPYTWFHRLGGVFVSAFVAVVSFGLSFAFHSDEGSLYLPTVFTGIAWTNVAISALNLLPALSLDGGQALLDAFAWAGSWTRKGISTIFYLGVLVSGMIAAAGVYIILSNEYVTGAWLLIGGVTLLLTNIGEYKTIHVRLTKYAE